MTRCVDSKGFLIKENEQPCADDLLPLNQVSISIESNCALRTGVSRGIILCACVCVRGMDTVCPFP